MPSKPDFELISSLCFGYTRNERYLELLLLATKKKTNFPTKVTDYENSGN